MYRVIDPPFNLKFPEMTKPELRRFYMWIMAVLPDRVAQVQNAVVQSSDFEAWEADYSPQSLAPLSRWFESQVTTRKLTDDELAKIHSSLKFPVDVPTEDLSPRTFSLAMDVGMYLGETVVRNVSGVRWAQELRVKRDINYGLPTVVGAGIVPMGPVNLAIVQAYKAAHGKPLIGLDGLYAAWAARLAGPTSGVR